MPCAAEEDFAEIFRSVLLLESVMSVGTASLFMRRLCGYHLFRYVERRKMPNFGGEVVPNRPANYDAIRFGSSRSSFWEFIGS